MRIDKPALDWDKIEAGLERLHGNKPAGAFNASRMYANALPTRVNQGFAAFNSSADAELVNSLRNLRGRSRQLIRDAGYAKSVKRVIVNNVIGTGIRLQALVKTTRGDLNERVNDAIEAAFDTWSRPDNCHTGGSLHFHDIERMAVGQVFEAGEIFIRIHRRVFGSSEIPFTLELIEPERLVEGYAQPGTVNFGNAIRMGIEVDIFGRPQAYWVRELHPGDLRPNVEATERFERVSAADMIHLRIIDRWPQTRGEPWLHAVANKLNDMNGYSEAEIIAARGAANYVGTIETPESPDSLGDTQADGSIQMSVQPGTWFRAQPGEKVQFITPNRPNSALDPFMRFMLREIAAGTGTAYESISRDYSQANYSSQRQALLEDRDTWRVLQMWFIRSFRQRLHCEWLQAAVLSGAIPELNVLAYASNLDAYNAVAFRPRGWSWVDPTKEVTAFKEAVKAGFTTVADVIAATSGGNDLEDVMRQREDELAYMDSLNLAFDTSPTVYVPAETRGQMLLDDSGEVVTAVSQEPAPVAPGAGAAPVAKPATAKKDADGVRPRLINSRNR